MPSTAPIAIVDGAATPVTHTFTPQKVVDNVAVFQGPGSTISGKERITVTRREATATVAAKISIKVELPTERTVDGITTVDYTHAGFIEFVSAPRGVKQNRKDLRSLCISLLGNAQVAAVVDDNESFY